MPSNNPPQLEFKPKVIVRRADEARNVENREKWANPHLTNFASSRIVSETPVTEPTPVPKFEIDAEPTQETSMSMIEQPIEKRKTHTHETIQKILGVVDEWTKTEATAKEIVEVLNLDGFKKASGQAYTESDVYLMRSRLKKSREQIKKKKPLSKQMKLPLEAAPENPAPTEISKPVDIRMDLISMLLKADLPTDEKLKRIQDVEAGQIQTLVSQTKEVSERGVELSSKDLTKRDSEVSVRLQPEQVELVLANVDFLRSFSNERSIANEVH